MMSAAMLAMSVAALLATEPASASTSPPRPSQANGAAHAGATGSGALPVAVPPGYSVTGIDVSNHQGRINWANVAAGGAKFMYAKASEGVTYTDPYFIGNYAGAKSNGLYAGAYHYARPDRGTGRAQADYFLDRAQYTRDGRTLPPMLDIEWPWSGSGSPYPCYGLSPAQMTAWISAFINRVRERTGQPTMIYTNTNWWNPCTGSSSAFAGNPLFIANYSGTPTPLPAGWNRWTLWQYSDSGTLPGDQDVFNGSLAELARLAGGGGSGFVEQSRLADIDGDGRDDLAGISGVNNDLTAYRNQGWNAPQVIVGNDRASLVSGFGDASHTAFADIDGDGRDDLIGISGANNDLTAYRNQGWNAPQVFVGNDRKTITSGFGLLTALKFADIDGDGRDDLIATTGVNNDVTAYRNQGWNAPALIIGNDRKTVTSGFGDPTRFKFADIDGDNRDDLVAVSGVNNDVTAYRNQGWNAPALIIGNDRKTVTSGFGDLPPLKFADIDGDDRDDLIGISGASPDFTAYRNQGWNAPALIIGDDRAHIVSGFPA